MVAYRKLNRLKTLRGSDRTLEKIKSLEGRYLTSSKSKAGSNFNDANAYTLGLVTMVKMEEFTDKAGYNRGRKELKIY